MPIPRRLILQGPCQIQTQGQTIYSKDNVVVKTNVKLQNIVSESIGLGDMRDDDIDAEISYTPDGQVTAGLLSTHFPYFNAATGWGPGMSIFGAAGDVPLIIWTRDGYKHVFNNTALTKQPDFMASPVKTVFGQATFRALRSDGVAASAANSLVTTTQAAYPGDANYNDQNIITSQFAARWLTGNVPSGNVSGSGAAPDLFTTQAAHNMVVGDRIQQSGFADAALNGWFLIATTPTAEEYTLTTLAGQPVNGSGAAEAGGAFVRSNAWDYFETESGFTVSSNLKTTEVTSDTGGVVDLRLDNDWLTVAAKVAAPIGPTPSDVIAALAFQGGTAGRGQSRNSLGRNLYLSGTGIYLKMLNAFMTESEPIRAAAKVKRIGATTWMSTPQVVGGAVTPPAAVSTNAIA